MILLLRGADSMGIRLRIDELKAQADGGSGMLATNFITIEGRDAKPDEVIGPVMTPPFLAPSRLILVEGLLERFEPRPPDFRPRSVESFSSLFAALESGIPETSILVFAGGEHRAANPFLDRLKKLPGVEDVEFPELKGEALLRWIREEAAVRAIRFRTGPFQANRPFDEQIAKTSDPAVLLADVTRFEIRPDSNEWRSDTLRIANELDKLALYAMGRDVTVDTVFDVCGGNRHTTNFVFADAVMDGNLRKALEALKMLLRDGVPEQSLLGFLGSRYRQMATIVELIEDGASPEEIGKTMGAAGRYANLRDAAIRRARRAGSTGVRAAFAAIVEADRAAKGGDMKEDLALELLVMKLTAGTTARQPAAAVSRR
jgi:DNA polymerase-3 subunit delta